jgi:hypothetical protein
VYGGGEAAESSDEFNSLFSKLIKWNPISCHDNTECLCIEFEAKKDIPLRYKYSKWCSVDVDNSNPYRTLRGMNSKIVMIELE